MGKSIENLPALTPLKQWKMTVESIRGFEQPITWAQDASASKERLDSLSKPKGKEPKLSKRGTIGAKHGTGVNTLGSIQIIDSNGHQVTTAKGTFFGGGDLHAEDKAIRTLLKQKDSRFAGCTIQVTVEKTPCPSCREKLEKFARKIRANELKVYLPSRQLPTDPLPKRPVTSKTVSTTALLSKTPVKSMDLDYSETYQHSSELPEDSRGVKGKSTSLKNRGTSEAEGDFLDGPKTKKNSVGRGQRLKGLAKKAVGFRLSFTGNILLEAMKAVLFSILEGMLNKTNQEEISRSYFIFIYKPYISKKIKIALAPKHTKRWSEITQKSRITLYHSYWVYMKHHSEINTENLVTFIGTGVTVQRSFLKVEAIPEKTSFSWSGELIPLLHIGEKEKTKKKNVFRYLYTHRLLVWDSDVFLFAERLKSIQIYIRTLIREAAKKSVSYQEVGIVDKIDKHLDNFEFLAALNMLPKTLLLHSKYRDKIKSYMETGESWVAMFESTFHPHQETLLSLYLDRNPFTLRKKISKN
ncbi:MAG: hypothetical protein R2568_00910 [Candidatus Scalindua sp.]|jgi:hypothetical protein|nr:hypothetical protein [Candidatus Scalindua sp.]